MPDKYICPSCENEVNVGSQCSTCNQKDKTKARASKKSKKKKQATKKPWEQDEMNDALDLPDDDFDYDEFVKNEFSKTPHHQIGIAWYWWVTALILLVILAFSWI